jgi:Flp pilus assembly protein TadG
MTRRLRTELGQSVLITVFFLTVLLGATALTLDVADWYREQRQAQATADAAALAGAQVLPHYPTQALTLARQYADSNGGGVAAGDVTLRSDFVPNDTVKVHVSRSAPGFFAKLFAIASVNVNANAAARADVPEEVKGAAPIVVNKLHPLLSGPGCPCFNVDTTLPLSKDGAPGAFGLMTFDPTASQGSPLTAQWVKDGFEGYLSLGKYISDPGASFNGNDIHDALTVRTDTDLLFPVYDTLTGGGQNAQYNIIGWVGFHLESFAKNSGNNYELTGYFTRVIWDGIQSDSNQHLTDYGVYSVAIVN